MKFLLDENLPGFYRVQLARHLPDRVVWAIGDPGAPLRGTQDPDILVWCGKMGFLLVTNNRASMPMHLADHLAQGNHIPGILVFRRCSAVKAILDDLILIAEASSKDEFQDQLVYILFMA
jgi:predicted nuclease of predicted toxin-antitoxin system